MCYAFCKLHYDSFCLQFFSQEMPVWHIYFVHCIFRSIVQPSLVQGLPLLFCERDNLIGLIFIEVDDINLHYVLSVVFMNKLQAQLARLNDFLFPRS